MNLTKYLFCFLVMLPYISVLAQEDFRAGYVITNELDTVHGLIQYKGNIQNFNGVSFKEGANQPVAVYTPEMISAYRFDGGKYYESKEVIVDGETYTLFLEYLIYGISRVYYGIIDKTEYYFVLKDDKMYVLPNEEKDVTIDGKLYQFKLTQFKGLLRFIYKDAPSVVNQVESASFNHKSMIKMAKNYHKQVCDTYECIVFEKSAKPNKYIEPMVGFASSTMRVRNSDDGVTQSIMSGGFRLHFTSIKFNDNWHFITGVNFSHISFDSTEFYIPNDNVNNIQRWKVSAEYSYFQVPLALSYSFGSGKLKPYLLVGAEATVILSPKYTKELLEGYRNRETDTFRKLQIGYIVGTGMRFQMNENMQLVLEGSYDSRAPAVNIGGFFDNHHVNTLQVGIGANIRLH
ncbi:MAG: outer membrane beta-barrel protein [Marinoscillum sp.]